MKRAKPGRSCINMVLTDAFRVLQSIKFFPAKCNVHNCSLPVVYIVALWGFFVEVISVSVYGCAQCEWRFNTKMSEPWSLVSEYWCV